MTTAELLRLLKKNGCTLVRNGGNHDIYSNAELKCSIPLKRHSFNKNDLRYILKEIEQRAKK